MKRVITDFDAAADPVEHAVLMVDARARMDAQTDVLITPTWPTAH